MISNAHDKVRHHPYSTTDLCHDMFFNVFQKYKVSQVALNTFFLFL